MNIDQYIYDLLYSIPPNVDYTDLPEELDREDISLDHVNGLLNIINRENDIYLLFRSSFLLNSWGFDEGFQKITSLFISKVFYEKQIKLSEYGLQIV